MKKTIEDEDNKDKELARLYHLHHTDKSDTSPI